MAGTLYIVGTPIGNLQDLSMRALEVLREVDAVYAEDTRHTRKLFSHFDIHTPLTSCHRHNEARQSEQIVQRLVQGDDVALVSDAGTPGIADPGARVVDAAVAAGVEITPIPGASALSCILSVAGRMGERVCFLGFLPEKKGKRRRLLEQCAENGMACVCYVARWDVAKYARECSEVFGAERPALIGRELTKQFEEIRRGSLGELQAWAEERERKGEFVLMIAADGVR